MRGWICYNRLPGERHFAAISTVHVRQTSFPKGLAAFEAVPIGACFETQPRWWCCLAGCYTGAAGTCSVYIVLW